MEARFNGEAWKVILSSGIVYEFRMAQISDRNASNQRIDKNLHTNKQNIAASVLPKSEISTWYVSSINNPNFYGEQIRFRYKTYGKFNFYKEYLQPRLRNAIQNDLMLEDNPDCEYIYTTEGGSDPQYLVCDGDTLSAIINEETIDNLQEIFAANPFIVGPFTSSLFNPNVERFNVYRDILLQEVTAHSGSIMTEKFDLEYETLTVNPADVNNMLLLSDPDVYQRDNLYNYKTVYHQGSDASIQRKHNPNSTPNNFSNWQRYKHFATWNETSTMQRSATNPYMGSEVGTHCNGLYYQREGATPTGGQLIPFSHSFLESGQVLQDRNNNILPSGELYEIRTLINTPQGNDGFCNFDINLVTGVEESQIPQSDECNVNPNTNISQKVYQKARGQNIFSTFNQSVKWNTLGNQLNDTPEYLYTSNFFSMPNMPTYYDGFYIQVGAANSDNIFNIAPENFSAFGVCPDFTPLTYSTYIYEYTSAASPYSSTAGVPNNFGVGLPWYLVHELYDQLDDAQPYCNSVDNKHYDFWWNYQNSPAASWANKPTLADERFSLINVELVRYSKNPYMLKGVKHYKVNGIVDNVHTEGLILVKEFEFEYSAKRDEVYDARSDHNVLTNKSSEHDRNIFFLDKIIEVPTNPTGEGLGAVSDEHPTTHFEYEKLTNEYFDEYYRSNANVHALSKIINPLGGITEISYYQMDSTVYTSKYRYMQDHINWNDPDLDQDFELQRSRPNVVQVYPRVLSKSICSGSNGLSKTWTYSYHNRVVRNNFPKLNPQFERDIQFDVEMGFQQTIVENPGLTGSGFPHTAHDHHGSGLLFGKLYRSRVYIPSAPLTGQNLPPQDKLLNETNYQYSSKLAYKNMVFTGAFLPNADKQYYKYIQSNPEVNPNNLNTDYQMGTTKIRFYETHFASELGDTDQTYLNSYFIKMSNETTKHYDVDGGVLSYELQTSNTFFEADSEGMPNSAFGEFFGGGKLSYDPSWQLHQSSTNSPNAEGSTNSTKRFYYYDLLNVYGKKEAFDALLNVYNLGRRDLVYEERTTKSSGGGSVENTSYYVYDSDWNKVRDIANLITIPIDTTGLTPCSYFEEDDDVSYICQGVPPTQKCCITKTNLLGEDPPFGFYATVVNNKPMYCRPPIAELESAFNGDIAALTEAVNDDNSPSGSKTYNLDDPLAHSLFLRKIHVKISETSIEGGSILSFKGQNYDPVFPYENWKAYEVLERNRFGQVILEENERGLQTQYNYQKFQPIQYAYTGGNASKYNCYNFQVTNQSNIGVPTSMIVGPELEDSLYYSYGYYSNYAVKNITDPNGMAMDYQYDTFGRLHQVNRAGKRISKYEYHQWQNDHDLSFEDRIVQNWVKSQVYHSEDESIVSVAYLDPLGRKQATMSGSANGEGAIYSSIIAENVAYDNWDRVIESQKPTSGGALDNPPNSIMGISATMEYETDQRGRVLKSYNYDNTYVEHSYWMINGIQTIEELELNSEEQEELIQGNPERFIVFKQQTTDEDGKTLMEYSNIFGQKIATKQFIGSEDGYAITLFLYDGHGNVSKVINPKKQVSTYTYNLMNWLTSKSSPDGGTYSYQHNASGQVRVSMEPLAVRTFDYDIFGRMTQQDRFEKIRPFSYNSIILPDDVPIQNKLIPEKKWFYNGSLYSDENTFHPQVKEFIPKMTNTKGRLSFSLSYSHTGTPNHYNLYSYHTEGYLKEEIKQFRNNGIKDGFEGEAYYVGYLSYNLQGSLLATSTNVADKGSISYIYNYDDWNRLSDVRFSLLPHYYDFKIASYQYDDPSGLLTQTTYYNSSTEFDFQESPSQACEEVIIDNIIYSYDIRDRLEEISSNLFDYNLYYGSSQPSEIAGSQNFNGNINASRAHYKLDDPKVINKPQHYLDNPTLAYGYQYDGLNRLINADTPQGGELDGTASYTYDKIGNLLTLNRTDEINLDYLGNPPMPDNYSYHYENGTNQLSHITSPNTQGRVFTYDGAGNLQTAWGHSTKSNPNITSSSMTTHNGRANLPYLVEMNEYVMGGVNQDPNNPYDDGTLMPYQIRYEYDANDQRIYKKVEVNTVPLDVKTEEYYVYDATGRVLAIHSLLENGGVDWYVHGRERIAQFQSREGDAGFPIEAMGWSFESFHYLIFEDSHIYPTYYIHDHLGNTRLTYRNQFFCYGDGTGEVENYLIKHLHDYFPYGKTLREFYPNAYEATERYQSTHHQRDTETNFDYRGARLYDADVGRFLSLDPLAADFPSWSDYNYVLGNPISLIDSDGKSPWKPKLDDKGNIFLQAEVGDDTESLRAFFNNNKEALQEFLPEEYFNDFQEFDEGEEIQLKENVFSESIKYSMENPEKFTLSNMNYDCKEFVCQTILLETAKTDTKGSNPHYYSIRVNEKSFLLCVKQ